MKPKVMMHNNIKQLQLDKQYLQEENIKLRKFIGDIYSLLDKELKQFFEEEFKLRGLNNEQQS